jgi:hypothetical protein
MSDNLRAAQTLIDGAADMEECARQIWLIAHCKNNRRGVRYQAAILADHFAETAEDMRRRARDLVQTQKANH